MRHVATLGLAALALASAASAQPPAQPAQPAPAPSQTTLLAQSPRSDWRPLDPNRTLYMDFDRGRVIIELSPAFAPNHVENIRTLVRERYFDGLAILRVQDNYVVQWGDPNDEEDDAKPIGAAKRTLAAEFTRPNVDGVVWTPLPDRDAYADQVGMADGFPAARDPVTGQTWLLHCYGMVAAARGNPADSGGGTQLYVVNGHAPRHLDRNMTVVGRVVQGMEILSALPRGSGAMGFYALDAQRTPINRVRFASELPESQRIPLEALRTDTETFRRITDLKRTRKDDFFHVPANRLDVCNVTLPVRTPPSR